MSSIPLLAAADIPLPYFLGFAVAAFVIGLFGVLVRRSPIALLLCLEIMLGAGLVNLVAFWRYRPPADPSEAALGPVAGLLIIAIAAAEVAVGIGLILLCYRRWREADLDQYHDLHG